MIIVLALTRAHRKCVVKERERETLAFPSTTNGERKGGEGKGNIKEKQETRKKQERKADVALLHTLFLSRFRSPLLLSVLSLLLLLLLLLLLPRISSFFSIIDLMRDICNRQFRGPVTHWAVSTLGNHKTVSINGNDIR